MQNLRQQVGVDRSADCFSKKLIIEAQGLAQKRKIEGYTYQQERGFDVADKVAANEAVGQFTNRVLVWGRWPESEVL